MKEFERQVTIRNQHVDGVSEWVWPATDSGAWDGPSREWDHTHKNGYLKFCKSFEVAVQAGGNCGLYPRLLANYFARVYTFEPDPLNFHCLVNNCQSPNIFKINAALGDRNGLVSLRNTDKINVGTHSVGGSSPAVYPCFTLDQLALDKCDLIQLDCEGYEPNVILGALDTITRFKPVISMETVNQEIMMMIEPLGYTHTLTVGSDKIFAVE